MAHLAQPADPDRLSTLAVAAFVCVFVVPPVAVVVGVIALNGLRRTPARGAALAKLAVVLGGIFTALSVLALLVASGLIAPSFHLA